MNIIARKPCNKFGLDAEYIVVDRGEGHHHRYVSATANRQSLGHNE